MKIALSLIVGAALLVGALENPAHSNENRCQSFGELASSILQSKYAGVPVSAAVGVIKQHFPKDAHKGGIALVMLAYGKPDYASEEYQNREIAIFRNQVEMECYRRESK